MVTDPNLFPIADKVLDGQWLSADDGLVLYTTRDLHGIGRLANFVRESLHGSKTFYNRNRHINYTNVCALSCKFCSFYRKRGEDGAYEMSVQQVIETAKKAADSGSTEVHIVGGLHPWLKFDYYTNMLSGIRRECPQLHIKAFTAIEIIHLSRVARMSIAEVLTALRDAGLGSLPGGGAEIFDDRVHDEVFKGKVREDRWFEVHRTAHRLGIFTNATMLYGHVETPAERVGHLIKLRELQAESLGVNSGVGVSKLRSVGVDPAHSDTPIHPHSHTFSSPSVGVSELRSVGVDPAHSDTPIHPHSHTSYTPACFNCVIPLSFIPEDSELGYLPGPTGLTDLRTLAIARLMLNNIAHIKAFWIMQGIGLSQLSLDWGVDDLDGTVVWYDITKREGHGSTHQEFHVNDIQRLIREAGKTPVERDTLYREIRRERGLVVMA